jgi:hypothetical protein
MPAFFAELYNYYYIILILQGICVIHSIRKGNQSKWIWIIVFLPVIGSIAYIFTEIIKKQHVSSIQSEVVNIVNPGGRIKDLEKKFKFTDTFNNRVALADAYLQSGMNEQAIELYEGGLKGMFQDNEHAIKQLMQCYYNVGRFDDVTRIAPKIARTVDFTKSRANILYALALEQTGKSDLAEKEFRAMNHRYSNYEARFNYGEFLLRENRPEDAAEVFNDIVHEAESMNRAEKSNSRVWIDKATEEWRRLGVGK